MSSHFLKQEKDRLTKRLIDDVSLSNEQVPLKRILEGNYPILFQELAKKEATKILAQENPIDLKENKRFDFDGEKFREQFSELKKSLLLELFLTADEIKKIARFSVGFQLDIIVKPRQTLLKVLFKESEEIEKASALDIISGFDEDRAFIRKIITVLGNENADKIIQDDFAKLAEKIERNVYKLTPISSFLTDVSLYLDFEISITNDYQTLFRSEVLHEMLTKRGLDAISKSILNEEERDFWTVTEIENAFERFLLVGNLEPEQQRPTKVKPPQKPALTEKQQKIAEAEKMQFNFLDEISTQPKEQREESQRNGNGTNGHAKKEPEQPEAQNEAAKENEANKSDFDSFENQRPKISTLINQEDKDFLVSTIFDNKTDEFSQFIEKLDEINKWQTARVAINEEIVKRNISPYSKEAILLGDVVFSRYFTTK